MNFLDNVPNDMRSAEAAMTSGEFMKVGSSKVLKTDVRVGATCTGTMFMAWN